MLGKAKIQDNMCRTQSSNDSGFLMEGGEIVSLLITAQIFSWGVRV